MRSLRGATCLVTGASSGIGRLVAGELCASGAKAVVLVARRAERLHELALELREKHLEVDCHVVAEDLAEPGGPAFVFNACERLGLEVDVLVHAAGVGAVGRFLDHGYETYAKMLELNNKSPVALTHLFLPAMLEKGEGGVLFVASNSAFAPVPNFSVYAASKALVLSFAEALHEEYRTQGLTVVVATPGGTRGTEFDLDVHRLGLSVGGLLTIPYPLEDAETVARRCVQALIVRGSPRLSPAVWTSPLTQLLMSVRHVLPRWALARLQGAVLSGAAAS